MNTKVVLITGCSSGIGYLTSLTFARNGWVVYATMRNMQSEGGLKLSTIAKNEKLDLIVLPLDVTSQPSVDYAITTIINRSGRIDILVNNAGFGFRGPVEHLTVESLKDQYETNVFGVIRMINTVLSHMKSQKSGMIINISSTLGLATVPLFAAYSSSKHALESISEALSYEVDKYRIKVVLINPGTFETNFRKNNKKPNVENTSYESTKNKMGRLFKWNKPKNAQIVANKIFKVAQEKNPKLHYLVGIDAAIINLLYKLTSHKFRKLLFKLVR